MSDHLSKAMLRVLRSLKRSQPRNAVELGCGITTLMALERRKLIRVETTFNSIAFPRKALAWLRHGQAGGSQ